MEFLNQLPFSAHFSEIKEKWSETGSYAIKAPTGSGKSLGIPLLLHKDCPLVIFIKNK